MKKVDGNCHRFLPITSKVRILKTKTNDTMLSYLTREKNFVNNQITMRRVGNVTLPLAEL